MSYPQEFPRESIREVIRIVTTGRTDEDKPVLVYHSWKTVGWILSRVFGDPNGPIGSEPTEEDIDELFELAEAIECPPAAFLPAPWDVLVPLLMFLLDLLKEWLEEQK